ncbi:hypothetical protein BJ546DRAFT_1048106 [Cryomyces antarcticus]
MALSAEPEQRARLIREMSRSSNRNRSQNMLSSPPVPAHDLDHDFGTMSSFDPENEAINSTRQLDNTATQPPLPNLRSSAQRFAFYQAPEPDFHIDTSALGQAFPDFSQDGSSDEHSMSIELGRGAKRSARNTPGKVHHSADLSSNAVFTIGNDSRYEVTGTPPIRPRLAPRRSDGIERGSLRREASVRRAVTLPQVEIEAASAHLAKTSDDISGVVRLESGTRRTLADMHAKVTSESDSSYVGEERPQATLTITAKNTRFGNGKVRQVSAPGSGVPNRFTSAHGLQSASQTPRRPGLATLTNTGSVTGNQTQQSFMLPDLPNLTELVSGVWKDGTPVFSRTTKSHSRFASGSHPRRFGNEQLNHIPIDSIPVPADEKAIFASLQLLKDKVAQLETEKSGAEKRMEEYEGEIIELRSQVQMEQRLRRPDSALGSDEEGSSKDKWRIEKTRLESSIKSLQGRLDRGDRKVSVADIAVKRITQERDNLVTQLGVAFYNSEELKAESEALHAENDTLRTEVDDLRNEVDTLSRENGDLRVQLTRFTAQHREATHQWTKKETELREKISRREEAVREMQDMSREIRNGRKTQAEQDDDPLRDKKQSSVAPTESVAGYIGKRRTSGRLGQETQARIANRVEQEVCKSRSEGLTKPYQSTSAQQDGNARTRPGSKPRQATVQKTRRTSASKPIIHENAEDEASEAESTTDLDVSKKASDKVRTSVDANRITESATMDLTYLSFMDGNEIAKLRQTLEEERRAARHQRTTSAPVQAQRDETLRSAAPNTRLPMTRKSSLKDVTGTAKADIAHNADNEHTGRLSIAPGDRNDVEHSDGDVDAVGIRVPKVRIVSPNASSQTNNDHDPKEITEVSILSNVSRRRRGPAFEEMTSAFILPDVTLHASRANDRLEEAKEATPPAAAHDAKTCTACPPHPTAATTLPIPTPIPVSARGPTDTDATLRPSQPPPLALATVLKQLTDELAHLKLELTRHEAAYNAHDPSLGKRHRKATKARIERLMGEIEKRADQVYALYDVLEGLGAEGRGEMGEREIEDTLMSVGIEVGRGVQVGAGDGAGAGAGTRVTDEELRFGDSGDESEELPWEGVSDLEDEERAAGVERRQSTGL